MYPKLKLLFAAPLFTATPPVIEALLGLESNTVEKAREIINAVALLIGISLVIQQ